MGMVDRVVVNSNVFSLIALIPLKRRLIVYIECLLQRHFPSMGKVVNGSNSKAQQLRNVDHLLSRNRRRKMNDMAATSVSRNLIAEGFTDSTVRTKAEKPGVKDIPGASFFFLRKALHIEFSYKAAMLYI